MKYTVHLTAEAERDLLDIDAYVAVYDAPEKAAYVSAKLEAACATLELFPLKGHIPPELERLGIALYREIHFKPYRIIYEVRGKTVFVHAVLDGRRDLQTLLERRLLR
ncbi:MAG: type II toxin-antitoxin system RelE/ParE family toxin [Lentisphaerae bacterium]|nr:type II toxin-antitoxin system RelE/ParE family toxin [Lentisphaerota bacterium]